MATPTTSTLVVKPTRNGKGIFAARKVTEGQTLYEVTGKRFHFTTLLTQGGTFLDNCFRLSENYYQSPEGQIGVYQNHSCTPNARVVKQHGKLFVVAVEDIPANAEVLIDYSTITASDDTWTMRCNCGAKGCRKIVRNWTKLPRATKEYYRTTRILPRYIEAL